MREVKKSKPAISREKAELIYRKVSSGEMTLNEARKEYGLPPIEDGDILLTKVLPDNNTV